MRQPRNMQSLEKSYAPRWSWRAVWAAASITILLYVGLPYLERLSSPGEPDQMVRPVTTVAPPTPLQPPPEPLPQERAQQPQAPELQTPPQRMVLPTAQLHLEAHVGDLAGDFVMGVAFNGDAIGDMIFEIGELDEAPRPVVQLRPQYPPQARLRQQEGYVTVEFIVNPDGSVDAPTVIDAEPSGIFDQAALRAVTRWRFSPGMRRGEAVTVRVRQRVEFRLQ